MVCRSAAGSKIVLGFYQLQTAISLFAPGAKRRALFIQGPGLRNRLVSVREHFPAKKPKGRGAAQTHFGGFFPLQIFRNDQNGVRDFAPKSQRKEVPASLILRASFLRRNSKDPCCSKPGSQKIESDDKRNDPAGPQKFKFFSPKFCNFLLFFSAKTHEIIAVA